MDSCSINLDLEVTVMSSHIPPLPPNVAFAWLIVQSSITVTHPGTYLVICCLISWISQPIYQCRHKSLQGFRSGMYTYYNRYACKGGSSIKNDYVSLVILLLGEGKHLFRGNRKTNRSCKNSFPLKKGEKSTKCNHYSEGECLELCKGIPVGLWHKCSHILSA